MAWLRYCFITGYKANLVGDLMGLYHQESEQQGISWEEEVSRVPSPLVSPEHRALGVRKSWEASLALGGRAVDRCLWACIIFQRKNAKSCS